MGRYEIGDELGRGGHAVVHEAWLNGPMGFKKPVALKILDEPDEASFAEARLGAALQHPNIVGTYAIEQVEGRTCIAMELVRGTTARHLLLRGPVSERATFELGL